MFLSVILPSYNEEEQIPTTLATLPAYFPKNADVELIFVDDGSQDGTWKLLSSYMAQERPVDSADLHSLTIRALRFSRNFGKELAVRAGLKAARGEAAIIMDCDLQHPPRYLQQMIQAWQEGYEVVEGIRARSEDESWLYRFQTKVFYGLLSFLTGQDYKNDSDFQLIDRKVYETINQLGEHESFYRGLSRFVGFRRKTFHFEVDDRLHGASKWSKIRLLSLALHAMLSFSNRPLTLFFGFACASNLLYLLVLLAQGLAWLCGHPFLSWSLVEYLLFFLININLAGTSLLGLYLGRVFEETKARPLYIIAEEDTSPPLGQAKAGLKESLEAGPRADLEMHQS